VRPHRWPGVGPATAAFTLREIPASSATDLRRCAAFALREIPASSATDLRRCTRCSGSRAAAGSGGSGGEKGTQAAAWPRRAAGGAAGVVCGGRVCCRCFFGHRCSRGGACGYTQATRVRACCCFTPLRLTALRRAQGGIRRPESVVPRLFRGAGLRPSELEAWTMWWCEASHVHATSSEGLHPSAACGLPKAPSWHPVPLDGAGWSLGAPLVCPASWADRASDPVP
jgi:hypothetical protein